MLLWTYIRGKTKLVCVRTPSLPCPSYCTLPKTTELENKNRMWCYSQSFETYSSDRAHRMLCHVSLVVEDDESALRMLDQTLHPNVLLSHNYWCEGILSLTHIQGEKQKPDLRPQSQYCVSVCMAAAIDGFHWLFSKKRQKFVKKADYSFQGNVFGLMAVQNVEIFIIYTHITDKSCKLHIRDAWTRGSLRGKQHCSQIQEDDFIP